MYSNICRAYIYIFIYMHAHIYETLRRLREKEIVQFFCTGLQCFWFRAAHIRQKPYLCRSLSTIKPDNCLQLSPRIVGFFLLYENNTSMRI